MSEGARNRDSFHVYMLIDPFVDGPHANSGVFYVGKGQGARAEDHELTTGESAKHARISEIAAKGKNPVIAYAAYKGAVEMPEREAFRLEAALIWALRPQLTNGISGHEFALEQHESLEAAESAITVELDPDIAAVFVWCTGIRSGRSVSGDFMVPSDDDAWENARGYWGHGKEVLAALDGRVREGRLVVLISLTKGKRGLVNIVNGVWQLKGWNHTESGQVVFERVNFDDEDAGLVTLRSRYRGNQLSVDGKILSNPTSYGYAPEGHTKMPRKSDSLMRS